MRHLVHALLLTWYLSVTPLAFSFSSSSSIQCPSVRNGFVPLYATNTDSKEDGSYTRTSDSRTNDNFDGKEGYLSQSTIGGYTVKQRLREEVESPFRKVRLLFFASSAGSASTRSVNEYGSSALGVRSSSSVYMLWRISSSSARVSSNSAISTCDTSRVARRSRGRSSSGPRLSARPRGRNCHRG